MNRPSDIRPPAVTGIARSSARRRRRRAQIDATRERPTRERRARRPHSARRTAERAGTRPIRDRQRRRRWFPPGRTGLFTVRPQFSWAVIHINQSPVIGEERAVRGQAEQRGSDDHGERARSRREACAVARRRLQRRPCRDEQATRQPVGFTSPAANEKIAATNGRASPSSTRSPRSPAGTATRYRPDRRKSNTDNTPGARSRPGAVGADQRSASRCA